MEDGITTKSLDVFEIEIYESAGKDFVSISRSDHKGRNPGMTFKKGDNTAAVIFLTQIAKLLGVTLVVDEAKE